MFGIWLLINIYFSCTYAFLLLQHYDDHLFPSKQLVGSTTSYAVPPAFAQDAVAGLFLKVRSTPSRVIPRHGFVLLQSNFIATGVADVPCTSSYLMLLILMPEPCPKKSRPKY